jgi:hypothetical protein
MPPASHWIYARIAFGTTFYGFGNLVWELSFGEDHPIVPGKAQKSGTY